MRNPIVLLILLLINFNFFGQRDGIPASPNPPKLVNNLSKEFPNFFTQNEEERLETKLVKFAEETSNEIVIIIVDDLNGYEPNDFATELGQQWKVGQEKQDNGIVILIKPTGEKGEKKYYISVGYGLEGAIPDLTCRQIEEQELLPNLKNGDFYKALDQTTDVLMGLAKGEINTKKYAKGKSNNSKSLLKIIIILVVIVIFIISRFRGGGRGGFTMGSSGIFFGGGFGGGGSSGGGGGGFGGFGGGSFGGGGSGGSW